MKAELPVCHEMVSYPSIRLLAASWMSGISRSISLLLSRMTSFSRTVLSPSVV